MGYVCTLLILASQVTYGVAPHYSKNTMERAARIHGISTRGAQCLIASSMYPLGTEVRVTASARIRTKKGWVVRTDPRTGKPWNRTQQCRVVDICNPADSNGDGWGDCRKNIRQKRILEFSWTDKIEMCGTTKELPEQCHVQQQLIQRGR